MKDDKINVDDICQQLACHGNVEVKFHRQSVQKLSTHWIINKCNDSGSMSLHVEVLLVRIGCSQTCLIVL